jgi:SAM-dependent methyltransferase
MRRLVKATARKIFPASVHPWLRRNVARRIRFGNLRRMTPISLDSGYDRGQPIDRYYIEKFLAERAADVRGRVMEFGDDRYISKFGGSRVERADVLHVVPGNPKATIIADLTSDDPVPENAFDCIIMTQTLQMIYDMKAAIRRLHRMLRPGGVLLVTTHGISPICRHEGQDDWGEYWHLTGQSARRLFAEVFGAENVTVGEFGNVLSAVARLHGLAAEELTKEELDYRDFSFDLLVTVRAVKAG